MDTLGITNARLKGINKRRDKNGFLKADMRGRRKNYAFLMV